MQWNGTFHVEFAGKSMETETRTRLEVFNGGKGNVEQILVSKERKYINAKEQNCESHSQEPILGR